MEFITTLWLPIVLSAVFVFIVSSVIHMFVGYHLKDFKTVPSEEKVMDSLRDFNIEAGDYLMPNPENRAKMQSEEFQAKVKAGPVTYLMVRTPNEPMGKKFILWFLYCILISVFSAYLGSHAVGPEGNYLDVFRFVGCAAFMGYSLAFLQDGIWLGKNWPAVSRSVFDGLLYALVTAGTFGWLWQ